MDLKIQKIQKIKNLKKLQSEIWKFEKLKIFEILHIFKFFPNFHFFQIFRIFWIIRIFEFNFQFFQVYNFKTEILILSRSSPDSNLVSIWSRQNPDLSLDLKNSRLWTKSGLVSVMNNSVRNWLILEWPPLRSVGSTL